LRLNLADKNIFSIAANDMHTESDENNKIHVLYSFPHKIGASRICHTAWQQVNGLANAGADVLVFPGAVHKPLPQHVKVQPTLAWQNIRIPYRLLGSMRAFALHDHIVARRLRLIADRIDIIHTWPQGALETLKVASTLGIPTVLERPNAHTRFAYEVVGNECQRLGVKLPSDHEHAFQPRVLRKEEQEYRLADRLLCPSDFTMRSFLQHGFPETQLIRHMYGYDENIYHSNGRSRAPGAGLKMLFVGVCAVRKGLHFAVEAWLRSPACCDGTFSIVGKFLPAYRDKLAHYLAHPSIRVLGHRNDVPELMRQNDILVLPSVEEGSPLAVSEAIGSGCVPLVSEACTGNCTHMVNALVHPIGNVDELTQHITLLHENPNLLERLRIGALRTAPEITWSAAGRRLLTVYRELLDSRRGMSSYSPALAVPAKQIAAS
jgi:glycosyltransferase involved in cell wall biosynthesis